MQRLAQYGSAAVCLVFAGSLAAQVAPPPPYLQIFREREKVGHSAAHRQVEAGWARAFSRAKTPNRFVAMTVLYGPPKAWFLQGAMSVAEIEAANNAVVSAPGLQTEVDRFAAADAAHVDGTTSLLARSTISEGFISVETLVFAPSPEKSYAPEEWIKKDPKYWGKKAAGSKP